MNEAKLVLVLGAAESQVLPPKQSFGPVIGSLKFWLRLVGCVFHCLRNVVNTPRTVLLAFLFNIKFRRIFNFVFGLGITNYCTIFFLFFFFWLGK